MAKRAPTAESAQEEGSARAGGRLSPYSTPSATRAVLERHGLYTKYGLGQNFLVNDDVIRRILELADVQPCDHVLEVGPGIGTLTAALLQRAAHVTAIEKDNDLPTVIADTLAPWADKFTLLNMDALDLGVLSMGALDPGALDPGALGMGALDPGALGMGALDLGVPLVVPDEVELREPGVSGEDASRESCAGAQDDKVEQPHTPRGASSASSSSRLPNKLVSNLPYAVAATVVLDYLQRFEFLESATVMVQKEVADRMCARPGTKTYGAYTVKLSLYAEPAGRFAVAPGNFFPPPHVESAVLRLNRRVVRDGDGRELTPEVLAATCRMADAAFATRRKTIANSCKTYFANDPTTQAALPKLFEQAGIDPKRRGETLSQQEFIALGQAFRNLA